VEKNQKADMTIYYYHLIPISNALNNYKNNNYPGHLLYGLTDLNKYGIKSIFHDIPFNPYTNRLRLSLYTLIKIILRYKKFDCIYGVTTRGLELIIFLRALNIFKKPICIWHHTAVVIPSNTIRKFLSSFFYKGIDKTFFFSNELKYISLNSKKIDSNNSFVIHWGPDIKYYDKIAQSNDKISFVSTGNENRDFFTLIKAFSNCNNENFNCYIRNNQKEKIKSYLNQIAIPKNTVIHFGSWSIDECAHFVNDSSIVVICCLNFPYTVGLTTLVEALALGKAIITTDNPTFPIDVEKEGIGIKVPYGDVEAWRNAIEYLSNNPTVVHDMGIKARQLAEEKI
jgi:glycosyltransferase involved in cell wall biosynthesis